MLKPSAVVELVWQDETGSTAVTALSIPSSLTVDEIDADASALASILVPLPGCVLIKQRIKYINVPETPVTASGSTPIARTGMFFFATDGISSDGLISIPAVKDSIIMTTGPGEGILIDETNADVIAFTDTVVDNGISNPFGDDFTSFVIAYLQSRV